MQLLRERKAIRRESEIQWHEELQSSPLFIYYFSLSLRQESCSVDYFPSQLHKVNENVLYFAALPFFLTQATWSLFSSIIDLYIFF